MLAILISLPGPALHAVEWSSPEPQDGWATTHMTHKARSEEAPEDHVQRHLDSDVGRDEGEEKRQDKRLYNSPREAVINHQSCMIRSNVISSKIHRYEEGDRKICWLKEWLIHDWCWWYNGPCYRGHHPSWRCRVYGCTWARRYGWKQVNQGNA